MRRSCGVYVVSESLGGGEAFSVSGSGWGPRFRVLGLGLIVQGLGLRA